MSNGSTLIRDVKKLCYLTGWGYHNQLGSLDTYAPHVLPSQSSLPKDIKQVWEQEITRAGFIPTQDHKASYLYRAHPGPSWSKNGIKKKSNEEVSPDWITGRYEAFKKDISQSPRKLKPLPAKKGCPISTLKTLFYNSDISIGVSTGNLPSSFFLRNADGDDLFFVHEGSGVLETELGLLGYETGHFLWIPKGIAYRFVPNSKTHILVHMENYGEAFDKPPTGFTGDAAVYYHRNIQAPLSFYTLEKGSFQTIVKANGGFTSYMFPFHPMDVVGWDGTLYPIRLHIKDINPITSWRAHIPPSAYCTFLGKGFELCCFVPRPVETGPNSLPVPFDHINIDRDEVIFYSKGVFFSKSESLEGSLTFHPRGFSHGPHPAALKRVSKKREKQGAFILEGYFILFETNLPLYPTGHALTLEDPSYINSWLTEE